MRILAIINGEYGTRHVNNVIEQGPDSWQIETWQAPTIFPPMIDYPEDHLPESLSPADLILSFAEHRAVAELLPEAAKRLFDVTRVSHRAGALGVDKIALGASGGSFHFAEHNHVNPEQILALIQGRPGVFRMAGAYTLNARLDLEDGDRRIGFCDEVLAVLEGR